MSRKPAKPWLMNLFVDARDMIHIKALDSHSKGTRWSTTRCAHFLNKNGDGGHWVVGDGADPRQYANLIVMVPHRVFFCRTAEGKETGTKKLLRLVNFLYQWRRRGALAPVRFHLLSYEPSATSAKCRWVGLRSFTKDFRLGPAHRQVSSPAYSLGPNYLEADKFVFTASKELLGLFVGANTSRVILDESKRIISYQFDDTFISAQRRLLRCNRDVSSSTVLQSGSELVSSSVYIDLAEPDVRRFMAGDDMTDKPAIKSRFPALVPDSSGSGSGGSSSRPGLFRLPPRPPYGAAAQAGPASPVRRRRLRKVVLRPDMFAPHGAVAAPNTAMAAVVDKPVVPGLT